ncbi:hypothetical protein NP493_708g02000 [Ridgeia piscesae]|uniref:Tubulin polyglutamylase TTLL2 n=1 Tax=Ridgeia piscesae TaxID=27915 RepID=A0AAD9KQT0_RIDPI|nr:hypothetical protein NP493_708g02000 [Ridgeia piscesae]
MSERQPFVFRMNDHYGQGPELVRQVFLERGWQEYDELEQPMCDWNLWWRCSQFRVSEYDNIKRWQWLNHCPKSMLITRKDSLGRNLSRMKAVYGPAVFNFSPVSFNLPNDYTKFVADYTRLKEKHPDKTFYWICKPVDLSRGRGIFIFRDLSELQYDCSAVIQQYITNPLLISGYKFDLRLYVLIPSFHPLTIYVYQEGLARFSTQKYDLDCLDNNYAHLTNTSINKHSPTYTEEKERVGAGCKWTLMQLRHYFHQVGIDDTIIWARIINIIILTVALQAHQVRMVDHTFELYGFDIIIDENLKPWLLEVNFSPALAADCQTDIIVKKTMLNDLIDMLNYSDEDRERGGEDSPERQMHKVYSSAYSSHTADRRRLVRGDQSARLHPTRYIRKKHTTVMLANKLPRIPRHTKAGEEMSGYCDYCGEGDDDDDDDMDDDNDNVEVVPIVPGCGLPSVQQPPVPLICKSSANLCSSNWSCSQCENRGEDVVRKSSSSGHLSVLTEGIACESTSSTQEYRGKNSMKSDSGISSHSGSSENLEESNHSQHKCQNSRQLSKRRLRSQTTIHASQTRQSTSDVKADVDGGVVVMPKKPQSGNQNKVRSSLRELQLSKGRSDGAPSTARNSHSRKTSIPRKFSAYATPWIDMQVPGVNSGKSVVDGVAPSTKMCRYFEPRRYGGFVCVFPFNEVTKRWTHNNLDMRVMVRECQHLLRRRVKQAKLNKQQANAQPKGAFAAQSMLWGIITTPETSVHH